MKIVAKHRTIILYLLILTSIDIRPRLTNFDSRTCIPYPPVLSNAAVLILGHTRLNYLRRTLTSYISLPSHQRSQFSLYVSLDYSTHAENIRHIIQTTFRKHLVDIWIKGEDKRKKDLAHARKRIARHYWWAIERIFGEKGHSSVIILEDDLLLSYDFLHYFLNVGPLLDDDHGNERGSLLCISAWNDNGFPPFSSNCSRLFRTSYIPNLAWMISRRIWFDETGGLSNAWRNMSASTGWDHWLRARESMRLQRECIFPEVPRIKHFGAAGANVRMEESRMLERMSFVNKDDGDMFVKFGDLRHLGRDRYMESIKKLVDAAVKSDAYIDASSQESAAKLDKIIRQKEKSPDLREKPILVTYRREDYRHHVAKPLRIHPIPRSHHQHTLILYKNPVAPLILADVRYSPYLPSDLVATPPSSLTTVIAPPNVSCTTHCATLNQRCEATALEWVNNCKTLQKVDKNDCGKGCGLETGRDLPTIVVENTKGMLKTEGMCLITEDGFPRGGKLSCEGQHRFTRRVCACVGGGL